MELRNKCIKKDSENYVIQRKFLHPKSWDEFKANSLNKPYNPVITKNNKSFVDASAWRASSYNPNQIRNIYKNAKTQPDTLSCYIDAEDLAPESLGNLDRLLLSYVMKENGIILSLDKKLVLYAKANKIKVMEASHKNVNRKIEKLINKTTLILPVPQIGEFYKVGVF